MPSLRKTSELVQDVAAACREQASGVTQINTAISTVDQVTQRNASAAEELASTAEELSSQAEALRELMGFFRVADLQGPHGNAPVARSPERHVREGGRSGSAASLGGASRANPWAPAHMNGDAEYRRL